MCLHELYNSRLLGREKVFMNTTILLVSNLSILKPYRTAKEWAAAKQYQKAADCNDCFWYHPFGGFDIERKKWLDERIGIWNAGRRTSRSSMIKTIGVQPADAQLPGTAYEKRPAFFFANFRGNVWRTKIENVFL